MVVTHDARDVTGEIGSFRYNFTVTLDRIIKQEYRRTVRADRCYGLKSGFEQRNSDSGASRSVLPYPGHTECTAVFLSDFRSPSNIK